MANPCERHLNDSELRSRLAAAHVAIVGCGGLGSNVAAMLLRSGVKRLTLMDFDRVTADNLNRQLFFAEQIGQLKIEALADTLRRIDADAMLQLVEREVSEADLVELVGDAHVVVEAVDSAQAKAMIVRVCARELPATPVVTVSGLAGYDSANLITTERLAENLYVVGDLSSDVREGYSLLATRVMVAAAHQAHAVIRLLLECEDI